MPFRDECRSPLTDATGTTHPPAGANPRIICLVPSITELLCALGLADQVVGRTRFCRHPREVAGAIPTIGGTKRIDLESARSLAPTHAIVNVEENTKEDATALATFVPNVIVTYSRAPRDNLSLYRLISGVFGRSNEAERLCVQFEQELTDLERRAVDWPRENVLYLIWKDPWMTVSRDTYISRMLALAGWDTSPPESAEPWPVVDLSMIESAAVRRVLLSSEPYHFGEKHAAAMRERVSPAVRVELIDGEMTSWYGSRAIAAMRYLGDKRRASLEGFFR